MEVPPHRRLKHVAFRAIEIRHFAGVREEAVAPPRTQDGKYDRLGEGRRLQVRNGRLNENAHPWIKQRWGATS